MDVQFEKHALDRTLGRYSRFVTYGEVQNAVVNRVSNCRPVVGRLEVLVKQLPVSVKVVDPEMFMRGYACGDKIVAKCIIRPDGCYIETIVLR